MEQRRRVPRRTAGWFGLCHIAGESEPEWRDCMVADVSMLGLGITLHHFWPSDLVGRHISIVAPATGDSVNVRFEGVIKNADRTSGSVVRLGIEFDGPSEMELALADLLRGFIDSETFAPAPAACEETPEYAIARPIA